MFPYLIYLYKLFLIDCIHVFQVFFVHFLIAMFVKTNSQFILSQLNSSLTYFQCIFSIIVDSIPFILLYLLCTYRIKTMSTSSEICRLFHLYPNLDSELVCLLIEFVPNHLGLTHWFLVMELGVVAVIVIPQCMFTAEVNGEFEGIPHVKCSPLALICVWCTAESGSKFDLNHFPMQYCLENRSEE